jgi:hypothetical protein
MISPTERANQKGRAIIFFTEKGEAMAAKFGECFEDRG